MNFKTVTVIGANGTMGTNVSGLFASFGDAKVYMVSRSLEKSRKAVEKAAHSVRAESVTSNLIPADYSMLTDCVAESDLVFESTTENFGIKQEITKQIAVSLPKDAVACTGTSGLSVTALAKCFPQELRSRYMGMHFFNPPYNMPLCEMISTEYTDSELLVQVKQYLQNVLYRTVVEVKDAPAFLANRIGFQFINEAMQYAEKHQHSGGIDYIDGILGSFTGRAMAPLTTADFVGMDVHKAIVDNLYANTDDYAHETFVLPAFAQKLITEGKLGRKSGGGMYRREVQQSGAKVDMVYDIASGTYRDKIGYAFPFARSMNRSIRNGDYEEAFRTLVKNRSEEAELCLSFLLKYVVYSIHTAKLVGDDIHSADSVMAAGFNWCPPLAIAGAFAAVTDLGALAKERLDKQILNEIDVDGLLSQMEPSNYDYRLYFKAAR